MSWKEFFKPTKNKMILFAIIFLIFSFIHVWPIMLCGSWECSPLGKGTFWFSLSSLKNKEFYYAGYLSILIYKFIISIVIAYIASSVMIKAFSLNKKENKSKEKKRR